MAVSVEGGWRGFIIWILYVRVHVKPYCEPSPLMHVNGTWRAIWILWPWINNFRESLLSLGWWPLDKIAFNILQFLHYFITTSFSFRLSELPVRISAFVQQRCHLKHLSKIWWKIAISCLNRSMAQSTFRFLMTVTGWRSLEIESSFSLYR